MSPNRGIQRPPRARRLGRRCVDIPESSRAHANSALLTRNEAVREAVRLLNGFRGYQLVAAACQLNLPDLVAADPKDAAELAAVTGMHPPSLKRALRGLVAWGFFTEDAEGRFAATAVSDMFRSDRPGLRNITLMLSTEGYRTWGDLMYVLRTGQPAFEHIYGRSRWEQLADDPEDSARFNAAMVELTTRVAQAFVAAYDFTGVGTVVDVAGGNGALLAQVLQSNADMDGILFDLPAGLAGAVERIDAAGLTGRVRLMEGSFFESVPSGADLYMLKSIIHDWDDAHARKILETCRKAMRGEARLVLVERLVPERIADDEDALPTFMSDLHMMVALGGRERTTSEYSELFDAAGLRLTREIPMASDFHAIEAVRA